MGLNVGKEVAALWRMTVKDLRERYAVVFGEATATGNKPWLVKRIAWRLQANAEGDLSDRAKARTAELARDADLRLTPPKAKIVGTETRTISGTVELDRRLPPAGSVITRKYKKGTVQVKVRDDGFEFEGEQYASLSAVAKAITGSHCNGFLFFRPNAKGGAA